MAFGYGNGIQQWEIAVAKKLVGEFRRRSRRLEREEFDDLLQGLPHALGRGACQTHAKCGRSADCLHGAGAPEQVDRLDREQGATKRGGDLDTVSPRRPAFGMMMTRQRSPI